MENKKNLRVLRARADFVSLFSTGNKSSPRRWVTFFSLENSTGQSRVGFTLSRKVGPAVVRNRLRRWSREFFRQALKEGHDWGVDINVVFRPMDPEFYKNLEHAELDRAFAKGLALVAGSYAKRRPSSD